MVSTHIIDQQLKSLGLEFKRVGRSEVRELARILIPGELIEHAANGVYAGGFALIVATNLRLLIVDKKPFRLNIEDMRYQLMNEVNFKSSILDAQIIIQIAAKEVTFRSWRQSRLRDISSYIEERVMQSSPDWQQRYRDGLLAIQQPSGVGVQYLIGDMGHKELQPYNAHRTSRAIRSALSRIAIKQLYQAEQST